MWRASSAGKDSPKYTPFLDTGDHVIVINAEKVRVTGMKADDKVYYRVTGFPGGIRSPRNTRSAWRASREQIVEEAIVGMLPHTKLGRAMAKKLKVYKGDKHPHMRAEAGSDWRRFRRSALSTVRIGHPKFLGRVEG